jgi:hypothetical protein
MKQDSLTKIIKDRGFGRLKLFITKEKCENGSWYIAHVYYSGDDDSSHNYLKRRTLLNLLKAVIKSKKLLINKI